MAGRPFQPFNLYEVCFVCCQSTDKDNMIKVGTALIHTYCFRCRECNDYLQKEDFRFEEGRLFCSECHSILYSRTCARCGKSMLPLEIIQVNAKSIHRSCLTCQFCNKSIKLDTCFKFAGVPFCDEKCALNQTTLSEHAKREKLRASLRLAVPPGKSKNANEAADSPTTAGKVQPFAANATAQNPSDVQPTTGTKHTVNNVHSKPSGDQMKNSTEQLPTANKENRAEGKPKN